MKITVKDFSSSLMVKTLHFQCRGVGSFPGWRNEIPHATQLGQKKKLKIRKCRLKITVRHYLGLIILAKP